MRIVLQRVSGASVVVGDDCIASIGHGLVVLVGVQDGDDLAVARRMASKVARLRVFANGERGFDRTVSEVEGAVLVVSQFTLMGDVRRGNRPSWTGAAAPGVAAPVVEAFAEALATAGIEVQRGRFGAMMDVALVNDGPVTLVLESDEVAPSA